MLQQISWSDYWKIIVILVVLYECSMLLLFYRKEIVLLAKSKRLVLPVARKLSGQAPSSSVTEDEEDNGEDDQNLIPFAHDLSEVLRAFIAQAAGKGYVKEELLFGLQQRIKDYPRLQNTRYQQEINTVILVECKTRCAIHLRAGELDKLWLS